MLTTGEMARLSNNTVRTVRFYEEAGLLQPAQRSEGGHRLFPESELDKLMFVTDLRSTGLSLEEIKELLEVKATAETGKEAAGVVLQHLTKQIDVMREKIAILERLKQDFVHATEVFANCNHCEDVAKFPDHCGECSVILDQNPPVPRAVRVLWNIHTLHQHKQNVQEGHEATEFAHADTESEGTADIVHE
jgi:DNA-binding transcriptional MerR regulator